MKVEFNEVVEMFESYEVWSGGREILWYKKAWLALEENTLEAFITVLKNISM